MGQPIARVGDVGVGVCPGHPTPLIYTTTFDAGSDTTKIDGQEACTIGSTGVSTCGHPTVALTGSPAVCSADGKAFHRVGDTGQNLGTYTVTVGSPNVSSD